MLEGIRANRIIVGAYTTEQGVCPMLAAHRAGGRTSLLAFAKAWDRFALGDRRGRRARPPTARPATRRELRILTMQLEDSLLAEVAPAGDLATAIAEHRRLLAARPLRVFRIHHDDQRALERVCAATGLEPTLQ
jgi:hypothetical protein